MFVLIVLSLALPSLFAVEAKSWYVGVSGDYVYNMMMSNTGYRQNTYIENGSVHAVNASVLYQITPMWGVESGLRFVTKNYRYHHDFSPLTSNETEKESFSNGFLEIPVGITLTMGEKRFQCDVTLGGFVGLWLYSYREGTYSNISETYAGSTPSMLNYREYHEFTDSDNRFEGGVYAKVGFSYTTDNDVLFVRGADYLSLTDLSKTYQKDQVGRYNNDLTVEAGILHNSFKK